MHNKAITLHSFGESLTMVIYTYEVYTSFVPPGGHLVVLCARKKILNGLDVTYINIRFLLSFLQSDDTVYFQIN